jgi:hypothetical protein
MQFKELEVGDRFVFTKADAPQGEFRKISRSRYVAVGRFAGIQRVHSLEAEVAIVEELANAA